ncbi:hypothetical protein IWQ57_005557 [Coemansia nantahalensis]|nr:hypothetical protein IWQ57_005557 [Coemansia nantahalensis]
MGMTPMMGPVHVPPPADSFHLPPPLPPHGVMAAAPVISHIVCSAQIGDKTSPCFLYRHDSMSSATVEQGAQQLYMADGRLFIEHIPNHSIVYIPLSSSIDEVLHSLHSQHAAVVAASMPRSDSEAQALAHGPLALAPQTHPMAQAPTPQAHRAKQAPAAAQPRNASQPPQHSQPRKPKEKSAKPINAFIKYRSFKIGELKRLYPDVSQTEISRLAGECWKMESEEIKNQFRVQYREEKKVYDMKKASSALEASKRRREGSDAFSDSDMSQASKKHCAGSDDGMEPAAAGLGVPIGFDASHRRRSMTMPPAAIGDDAGARAASASPLMTAQQKRASSKRRRCVTGDLRKQLAAKFSLLATPPLPAATVSLARTSTAPAIGRSQSMGLDDPFCYPHDASFVAPDFGYYGALPLAHHLAADSSPYLGDMAPLALPHVEAPALTVDTSFVSVPEDAAACSAFDLYTTASDHDELANSIVSASLVAASLSTLMASSQSIAPLDVPASMVATALPLAEQVAADPSM